jgi:hypothetical protein
MADAWAADMSKDGSKVDEAKRVLSAAERFANAPVLVVACFSSERLMAFAGCGTAAYRT